jgi:hypothetical protein
VFGLISETSGSPTGCTLEDARALDETFDSLQRKLDELAAEVDAALVYHLPTDDDRPRAA